jgi:hypothetical protein
MWMNADTLIKIFTMKYISISLWHWICFLRNKVRTIKDRYYDINTYTFCCQTIAQKERQTDTEIPSVCPSIVDDQRHWTKVKHKASTIFSNRIEKNPEGGT